ncbi:MAG: hypothetical protein EZS28_005949 [Streblomastix strix]|uniref:Uncharacterized protein n=1 Tax=Streblomastix strix TaxID=222440 RepID=A0A5J4WUD9_9EUKA|nr:MAG: hypothetical protein EZS28_005949 [Streblomastix strix]
MSDRTNIQVTLQGSLAPDIVDNSMISADENQNSHISFIATRAYPTPTFAQITRHMHYLCDAIIRFTFDDVPDPQIQQLIMIRFCLYLAKFIEYIIFTECAESVLIKVPSDNFCVCSLTALLKQIDPRFLLFIVRKYYSQVPTNSFCWVYGMHIVEQSY